MYAMILQYFNPRSSCEERLHRLAFLCFPDYFNPRSSCEERPGSRKIPCSSISTFQSTLLMRGATRQRLHLRRRGPISIHAPHARSDWKHSNKPNTKGNFNPRSSCEERRALSSHLLILPIISIHAPHARSDLTSRPPL